ncbi:MAG: pirin family protein, partial [Pseudomonadota bacterium]|nr:pirin family protein [Pseudomonadota bacterium]
MKKVLLIHRNHPQHWVGDGFPVRSIFSYNTLAGELSPFLLLDYAGPAQFPPSSSERRGVGAHPHRGFETVTLVYDGQVEHRDSSGAGGVIGPGDVQWMTAGSGIVHEEFHGPDFRKTGGPFEMIQLWVNLAAKDKKAPPGYQNITRGSIPVVNLPDNAGQVRVIAGDYNGTRGPARTFSPLNVWDVRLKAGGRASFHVKDGETMALFVLKGHIRTGTGETAGEAELVLFERTGEDFLVEARE